MTLSIYNLILSRVKMHNTKQKDLENNNLSLWSLAWDLGWIIAIPIVILAIGGAILDKKMGTSPWILLTGVILSVGITSFAVYYKVTKILGDLSNKEKEYKK